MSRVARFVYHTCRLVLGGVFLYAGAVKAAGIEAFAGDIADYRLLPYHWNYLVAATLPYVEGLIGLLLLANRRVRPAALLAFILTLLFMVVLASVVARGLEIDCGCFNPGAQGDTGPGTALLRDAILLVLAGVTLRLRGRATIPR